jgi:hypothetical protein
MDAVINKGQDPHSQDAWVWSPRASSSDSSSAGGAAPSVSLRVAFGVWVQPETCTVRVESDLLTPSEIQALVDGYGTALSFDTTEGSAGMPLR